MAEFTYGPVELLLISFEGDRPGPALGDALLDLIEEKTVTLLDLIFVSRSAEGDLRIVEVEDLPDRAQLPDLELGELGLAGLDDVEELGGRLASLDKCASRGTGRGQCLGRGTARTPQRPEPQRGPDEGGP